jgi:hypothetical protein
MSTAKSGATPKQRRDGAGHRTDRPQTAHAIPREEFPLTLTVPEAGKRYFGLSRNGSYNAAADGTIPTVRIGKLLRVPVRALEAMLDHARRGPEESSPSAA